MMRIDSSWIHPMRYGRTRPFGRELAQLAGRRAGRGFLALDDLNALLGRIMGPYNDAIDHLPRDARPARPTPILNAEVSLATSVGRFEAWGRNIFWLTPALVEMLEHTDLSGVHLGDLQFPYDMCYVAFGDRLAVGLPGPPNQVDGAYVEQRPDGIAIHVTARRLDPGSQSPRTWPLNRELVYTTVLQGAPEDALAGGYLRVRILGAELASETAGGATGREVQPHWRRGHWRWQPYGPGMEERRRIWIRPTQVRRDRGEPGTGHLYELHAPPTTNA